MPSLTKSINLSGLGGSISAQVTRTPDGGGAREVAITAGQAGTLSGRTDNETGVLTLSTGHGIITGQTIDLYWSGGARYQITVGTVSGNSVPIGADNLGYGSNLPALNSAIVVGVRSTILADVPSALSLIGFQMVFDDSASTSKSHIYAVPIAYTDPGSDQVMSLTLTGNEPRLYDVTGGETTPISGDAVAFIVSTGSTAAGTFKMLWVADSTV